MGQWDCRICGLAYSKMLTPTEYRSITFCSEACRDEYKAKHPRRPKQIKLHGGPQKRSPGMGVWRRDGGMGDMEGYR